MNESLLQKRARRAFMRGRLREALGGAGLAGLLVVVALLLAEAPSRAALLGLPLVLASAAFAYVGREAARALWPALLLGTLPLGCALAAPHLGHLCTGSGCVSLCLPLCTAGGLAAGVLLSRFALAQARPWRVWWFGAVVTVGAGALGCACAVLPSVVGMALGVGLPHLVRSRFPYSAAG
jgi:hypothetical protein